MSILRLEMMMMMCYVSLLLEEAKMHVDLALWRFCVGHGCERLQNSQCESPRAWWRLSELVRGILFLAGDFLPGGRMIRLPRGPSESWGSCPA